MAASYREAAGITDPDVSLGEVPRGVPELAESWRAAARVLEIPDELAAVRGMSRADLEALTARYEQVQRAAPVEVSRELRAAELRAADLTAEAAELEARGLTQEAADHRFAADVQSVHATELTGRHEVYQSWQDLTAPERHEAELAAAELARRKAEREAGDRQADAPEREPEVGAGAQGAAVFVGAGPGGPGEPGGAGGQAQPGRSRGPRPGRGRGAARRRPNWPQRPPRIPSPRARPTRPRCTEGLPYTSQSQRLASRKPRRGASA